MTLPRNLSPFSVFIVDHCCKVQKFVQLFGSRRRADTWFMNSHFPIVALHVALRCSAKCRSRWITVHRKRNHKLHIGCVSVWFVDSHANVKSVKCDALRHTRAMTHTHTHAHRPMHLEILPKQLYAFIQFCQGFCAIGGCINQLSLLVAHIKMMTSGSEWTADKGQLCTFRTIWFESEAAEEHRTLLHRTPSITVPK